MKNIVLNFTVLLLILAAHQSFAHGDHHHRKQISEKSAFQIATKITSDFTQNDPGLGFGQLNKSWNDIVSDSVKMFEKGNGYYIVSVNNSKESKTIYILMSTTGKVYDANFTGKFPKLKKNNSKSK